MKNRILVLIDVEGEYLDGYIPPQGFKRIILISRDPENRIYLEKAIEGNTFVSFVPFSENPEQVLADIYAKIGTGDANPMFEIMYFSDDMREKNLAFYLTHELKGDAVAGYHELLKKFF